MSSDPAELLKPSEDHDEDVLYRRTVRLLYLVALGLNAWLLWGMVKDDPEVQLQVGRAKAWWAKLSEGCEGCAKRKATIKHVIREAEYVVWSARKEEADGPGD